ncbi:unnamed protein product [Pylaiella littoralis]
MTRPYRPASSRRRAIVALYIAVAAAPCRTTAFCCVSMNTANERRSVNVCTNTSCRKADSRWTLDTFRAFAPASVEVVETGCQGRCGLGPNILTRPSEEVYNGVAQPATTAARMPSPPQIEFEFPVADALLGAYGHVTKGDVLYKRGLFADALACYTQCIETAGAFEGNANALSVAKVKQSSAMRMVAKGRKQRASAASSRTTTAAPAMLEEAEASAREAVELYPAHTAAWLNLCDVLVDLGRVQEALETLATLKAEIPAAKLEASEKATRIRNTRR